MPNDTSARTPSKTTWSSGSWKSVATLRRARPAVSRVSQPPISTLPPKRPPWKCGTRPARARISVVLPQPERPPAARSHPARHRVRRRRAPARRRRRRRRRTTARVRSLQPPPSRHEHERPHERQPVERPPTRRRRLRCTGPPVAAGLHRLREIQRPLQRPGDDGRNSRARPRTPVTSTPRPRSASTSPRTSRSSVGTSLVASGDEAERRANRAERSSASWSSSNA